MFQKKFKTNRPLIPKLLTYLTRSRLESPAKTARSHQRNAARVTKATEIYNLLR